MLNDLEGACFAEATCGFRLATEHSKPETSAALPVQLGLDPLPGVAHFTFGAIFSFMKYLGDILMFRPRCGPVIATS